MESQLPLKNDFIDLLLKQTAEDEGLTLEEYIFRHIRQYEDQTGEELQALFVAGELDSEELEELLLTSHLATHEVNEVTEQYYYELRKGMTIGVLSVVSLVVGIIFGVIAVVCAYNDAYGASLTCGAIGVILACVRLGTIIWASTD
ncbi:hypothetical protein [Corynebacterium vitaeruminis]|uniref:hypothetical protein n=1 Tax=Corynebacterium vitaeruminis TaxID=38305 RepID=UPI000660CA6F|nr:hypothetical protein [Corynebacterium vitaeruminis]